LHRSLAVATVTAIVLVGCGGDGDDELSGAVTSEPQNTAGLSDTVTTDGATTTTLRVPGEEGEGDAMLGGVLPDELRGFPLPPDAEIVFTLEGPPVTVQFDSSEDFKSLADTYEDLLAAAGYEVVGRSESAGLGVQLAFRGAVGSGKLTLVGTEPSGTRGDITLDETGATP